MDDLKRFGAVEIEHQGQAVIAWFESHGSIARAVDALGAGEEVESLNRQSDKGWTLLAVRFTAADLASAGEAKR